MPMDNIVNYFVLAFIFVFDPLAILLLISANKAFSIVQNNSKEFKPTVEDHRDYFRPPHPSDAYEEEAEQRMDIIGQNGNDGLHYDANGSIDAGLDYGDTNIEVTWTGPNKKELDKAKETM